MLMIIVVMQWAWDADWYTVNDDDGGVLITCSDEMIECTWWCYDWFYLTSLFVFFSHFFFHVSHIYSHLSLRINFIYVLFSTITLLVTMVVCNIHIVIIYSIFVIICYWWNIAHHINSFYNQTLYTHSMLMIMFINIVIHPSQLE